MPVCVCVCVFFYPKYFLIPAGTAIWGWEPLDLGKIIKYGRLYLVDAG